MGCDWPRGAGDLSGQHTKGSPTSEAQLAHDSKQSEMPASKEIMNFRGLGLGPYEIWLARRRIRFDWRAHVGVMNFGGSGLRPYEIVLAQQAT